MPKDAAVTAEICLLFNNLFDCMNGPGSSEKRPSIYRCLMTDNSLHWKFFKEAKSKLKQMQFVNKTTRVKTKVIPCIPNLISTIEGFEIVWDKLKALGFEEINPRFLNQDPLENFFGSVRSYCNGQYTRPTCLHFKSVFKCLLLNNLTSDYAMGANCMEDSSYFLFNWPQFLPVGSMTSEKESSPEVRPLSNARKRPVQPLMLFAIGDFDRLKIIQKFKQTIKNKEINTCQQCCDFLCTTNHNFKTLMTEIQYLTVRNLSQSFSRRNISEKTYQALLDEFENYDIDCNKHRDDIKDNLLKIVIERAIFALSRSLNIIIKGRMFDTLHDTNKKPFSEFTMRMSDEKHHKLTTEAYNIYVKSKKKVLSVIPKAGKPETSKEVCVYETTDDECD